MSDALEPLISIIIPTYNRAHIIEKSVRSVCAQTYQNIEILIIDDGSTDPTQEIISSIADSRIKYFYTSSNKGPSAARNYGIKEAKGELIAFHDSDDICYPDKLKILWKHYIDDGKTAGLIFHPYHLYTPGKKPRKVPVIQDLEALQKQNHNNIFSLLLNAPLIGTPTMMIPKKILEKVGGFNEQLQSLEDYELSLRIASLYPVLFVNEILLDVEKSSDGVNNNIEGRIQSIFYILEEFDSFYKKENLIRLRAIQHSFYESQFLDANLPLIPQKKSFSLLLQKYLTNTNRNTADKISIILPCYNVAAKLDLYLSAILSQTIGLSCLEIIIINNASTDSTDKLLAQYEQLYPDQIMLVQLTQKETIPSTMNIGMQYASGKYIYYVEPGAILSVTALEILYHIAESNHSEITTCHYTIRNKSYLFAPLEEGTITLLQADSTKDFTKKMLSTSLAANPWNKLYQRDFFTKNNLFFLDTVAFENIYFHILSIFVCQSYCNTSFVLYEFEDSPLISSEIEVETILQHSIYASQESLKELESRNLLQDILQNHFYEFEYFFSKKLYYELLEIILPIKDVSKRNLLCMKLLQEFLLLFPDAANNPIMESQHLAHWKNYKSLLLTAQTTT